MVYPENVIWYVAATPPNGELVEGSAVAIRLQRMVTDDTGTMRGDPHTARTYLLTCAHVLRDRSSDGAEGFGKLVSESMIRAWMPETGRSDDQAKKVRLATEVRPILPDEIPLARRSNPLEDWVVLELLDDQSAQSADGLVLSDFQESPSKTAEFRVVGYPGGAASHQRGVVIPTSTGPFEYRDTYLGLLRLVGDQTAPGMSGGGVFQEPAEQSETNSEFLFCGLHRARQYDALQLHSVCARTILRYLNSDQVPFEVCQEKPRKRDGSSATVWTRRAFVASGIAALAGVGYWLWNRRTRIRIGVKQWVGYAPLVIAKKLDLRDDIDIQFKKVTTINEAAQFVDNRTIDCGAWMAAGHVLYRSQRIPAKVFLKLDDSYKDDGIVTRPGIGSVADLVGKEVGVQLNDAGHCLLLQLCAQETVDITKIKLKEIPPDLAPFHFQKNKDMKAVTTYAQFLDQAVDNVSGAVIRWTAADMDEKFGIVDVLSAHEEFLAEHEDALVSLIEGWYEAVDLLNVENERALSIACHLLGEGETDDPTHFSKPLDLGELKKLIRPESVKLSGRKENEEFFRRDGKQDSRFREFYEHYEAVWPSTSMEGGNTDFFAADGSQQFARLWHTNSSDSSRSLVAR